MSLLDKHTVKDILKQIVVKGSIRESNGNFNFSCVLCGDSKKSQSKKRGWVLFDGEKITYHCFNCNQSISFKKFLKDNYPNVYSQYIKKQDVKDILRLNHSDIKVVESKNKETIIINDIFEEYSFDIHAKNIDKDKMMLQYEALKFALNRNIPHEYIKQMRVCYDGKYRNRLLIPYYNDDDDVYCFQARALTKEVVGNKYLTYKPDNNSKIFRYYISNPDENVFITEGPIDAMFFDNGLATSGIAPYGTAISNDIIEKYPHRIWVFDKDKTGIDEAIKYAEKNEYVFCWPKEFKVKDVNDLILKYSLTKEQLKNIILENACTGFKGVMKLKLL